MSNEIITSNNNLIFMTFFLLFKLYVYTFSVHKSILHKSILHNFAAEQNTQTTLSRSTDWFLIRLIENEFPNTFSVP